MLGEKVPAGQYEDILKDGIVLCKLINKLAPGSVKKIQERGTNFQLMENIQRFQAAVKKYGVPEEEIFQTADLFERRNISQVTLSLYALGRIVSRNELSTHLQIFLQKLCSLLMYRLKSIQNSLVPPSVPRWLTRMSANSPRSNYALTRATSTCRWATIRVPHSRGMAVSATRAICKQLLIRFLIYVYVVSRVGVVFLCESILFYWFSFTCLLTERHYFWGIFL